jgi:hypothetical protein
MARKTHNVKSYSYYFSAPGGAAALNLWNDQGVRIAFIRFVDDTSPLPIPTVAPDFSTCNATFRRSALPGLIDMLRNESPVLLDIGDGPTVQISAGTTGSAEPVGEGES